jgi:hypothetical protein
MKKSCINTLNIKRYRIQLELLLLLNFQIFAQDCTLTLADKAHLKLWANILEEQADIYLAVHELYATLKEDSTRYKNINTEKVDKYVIILSSNIKQLQDLELSDSTLNTILKNEIKSYQKYDTSALLLQKSISTARKNKGWNQESSIILSEFAIVNHRVVPMTKSEKDYLSEFPDFMNELSEDAKVVIDGRINELGFSLGVVSYFAEPLKFIYVKRQKIAYKLGFKDKDKILAINGVEAKTLYEVMNIIKNNIGNSIDCKIVRNGKPKTIKLVITADLIEGTMVKRLDKSPAKRK